MSQRDLVAELRAAHIQAPPELRQRVRALAATAAPPRRRLSWRRALVVAVPVAAAVAATIVVTRPSHNNPTAAQRERAVAHGAVAQSAQKALAAPTPAPSTTRVQRYGAYLALRVPSPNGVSTGVKAALRITKSLGGYASSVHANVAGKTGGADLALRVPRAHVQEAISRLSALGTITAERVDVQDLTTELNATDRTIARLQRQLAALRAQPPSETVTARIEALTRRVQQLQRGEASTLRGARYATVDLHLATAPAVTRPAHHGPLHGLGVAFRWIGIGLVYGFALGVPFVLLAWLGWLAARTLRRRREDALLSRP
jgi:hypothetical protein